jgi:AcrR family transcriptional regulator
MSAARRRGRPRSFDAHAALGSARSAFWNKGYAGATLDDITAVTGLNRPSLYGAFGDKRALYLAALERSRDETLRALSGALGPPRPLREALALVYARAIDIYLSGEAGPRGCFIVGTAPVEAINDEGVRTILADTLARIDDAFAARFEEAKAAGELPPTADAAALALLANAVLNNLSLRARAGLPRETLERTAAAGILAICRGGQDGANRA